MGEPQAAREELVQVCRRLYERGLIGGSDGNVSVRIASDRLLVTPSGIAKVDLGPADLVEVSPDGARLAGTRRASSEIEVHLRIYRRRPDVMAVVHAILPPRQALPSRGRISCPPCCRS